MSFPGSPASLEAVRAWYEESFRTRGEMGASVSIWQHGQEVMNLAHGYRDRAHTRAWERDTLVPVWSATKGPAAVCCLLALEEAGISLECPVAEVWPEFAGGGKSSISLIHLLSHTAGLCALDERAPIYDYDAVVEALERQRPLWEPGTRQGYHARTFGFLLDEIVRRLTEAESLGEYYREVFGSPMGLDFWIGLPSAQWDRVSPVYPGKISIGDSDQPFIKAFNTAGTLTQRTFTSPFGLNAVSDFNQSEMWSRGYASMGGVGNAQGLAKFYAMLAQGGVWNGVQIVPETVVRRFEQTLTQEVDSVLLTPIAFSTGMMKDPLNKEPESDGGKLRQLYGPSRRAYGHPGAGGSLAFADPENGISFAYTMNQMEIGALPGERVLGLVRALYGG